MNKLKHIYIYTYAKDYIYLYIYIHIKKCTNKNAYILDLYTEKKHVSNTSGTPKIPAESQNLKCLAGHLAAKTSHLIPLCTVDGSKLWKNLLKLGRFGSDYPTLCGLLYLTGG